MSSRQPLRLYIAHTSSLRLWVKERVIPDIQASAKITTGQGELRRDEPFFICVNPFDGRFSTTDELITDELKLQSHMPWLQPKLIVQHDLNLIFTCEAMFVINTSGPSYGSIWESAIFFQHTKGTAPIIYVVREVDKNHPWLKHFGHAVVTTIEAGINALKMYYNLD